MKLYSQKPRVILELHHFNQTIRLTADNQPLLLKCRTIGRIGFVTMAMTLIDGFGSTIDFAQQ
ncbi:hypothetical protein D1872_292960 [compost metagenome]